MNERVNLSGVMAIADNNVVNCAAALLISKVIVGVMWKPVILLKNQKARTNGISFYDQ